MGDKDGEPLPGCSCLCVALALWMVVVGLASAAGILLVRGLFQ